MKKLIENMENVKHGEFDVNGVKWTIAKNSNGRNRVGTSSRGIWNDMTNGVQIVRIYKADVLKIDKNKAIALFN